MPSREDRTHRAPLLPSADWSLTAGRSLMSWWNDQGPVLAPSGERYRVWWKTAHTELEDDLLPPGDMAEQLEVWSRSADDWWTAAPRSTTPPPLFASTSPVDAATDAASAVADTVTDMSDAAADAAEDVADALRDAVAAPARTMDSATKVVVAVGVLYALAKILGAKR